MSATPALFPDISPDDVAKIRAELADIRKRIGKLLSNAGSPATCRGCGEQIYWVRHSNGKNTPYVAIGANQGVNHFENCPERERFKRK